jgi:hypothetical protein
MGQRAGSKQLDRLEVVSLLGRGAFAEVFLVTDRRGARGGHKDRGQIRAEAI